MQLAGPAAQEGRPLGNGYFLHRLSRPDGSAVAAYCNRERLGAGPPLPGLVVITGSGCASVFPRPPGSTGSERLPTHFLEAGGDRHTIFFLEKRGVCLFDPGCDGGGENCSDEYHAHASHSGRVAEHLLLVGQLARWAAIERRRVALVGFSEGAAVAAAVAALAPEIVSHLALLSGGGPTQMFELASLARRRGAGQPPERVEAEVAALMRAFRAMFEGNPKNGQMFLGHPVSRWRGFLPHAPIDDLLRVQKPVFVGHGSEDRSVPVGSVDFIEAEFIRHRKSNLTVRRYPGLDHRFQTVSGGKPADQMGRVIRDLLVWFEGRPAEAVQ
jgi:pimeloyl-ACP methyl ester carboxylesterase